MKPFQKLISRLNKRFNNSASFIGAPSLATWNPRSIFTHFSSDAYSSSYPSIRAIANEYKTVRPYAIDANGKRIKHPAVDALYHPNKQDSSVAFAEKVAVSTLVHRKTYILVWRREGREAKPGGDFKTDEIAGFTFLEYPSIERLDGKTFYKIGSQQFSENEVMVLPGGVDPHNLYAGFSPSESARRWATLDDYVADYQKGFFENGAVPAGQFLITAATTKEYDDIVNMLQERHAGAGKNGNVTYAHRPVDPNSGKPAEAQIEWVPFSQSNKDIDFKNLFEQTNKRIDMSFGVSQFIKGVDDAPNYATAQVSDKNFAKRAVNPLLLSNYTQITHELNRITNGLGVAITYDYDIPIVADEEKVEAETKVLESQVIRDMVSAGYTLDSVIDAFKLSTSYKLLKEGDDSSTDIDNDKPDVDEGSEVTDAPDPSDVDGITPLNKKGGSKNKNPKAELTDLQKLEAAARKYMQAQVDKAVDDYEKEISNEVTGASTDEQEDEFIDDMMLVIVGVMVAYGVIQYIDGKEMLESAGVATEALSEFILSEDAQNAYRSYLRKVGQSYSNDTAEAIRKVLATSDANGWTAKETKDALRGIMNTDEWRIKRLAETELNRSQSMGGLESMKQIQAETGTDIEKSLSHEGSSTVPCEFCRSLENQWTKVDQPLIALGETLNGADGGTFINDFVDIEAGDVHPNGKGTTVYRVST